MYKVLTIAGSDPSGGAGIQGDLKTMAAHGVYGMSAITALTAQNTLGVQDILESTPAFLEKQLDCIFTDIFPQAVKIGMVANTGLIEVIAAKLQEYAAVNIVLDPVMVATSGSSLMESSASQALKEVLMPVANIITPNLSEAQALSGLTIHTAADMEQAAAIIGRYYSGYILVKGGHSPDNADDLLYYQGETHWLRGRRIDNPNTHGTGCTLSSAIACELAAGRNMLDAVAEGKKYINAALQANLNLGQGRGPLNHNVNW